MRLYDILEDIAVFLFILVCAVGVVSLIISAFAGIAEAEVLETAAPPPVCTEGLKTVETKTPPPQAVPLPLAGEEQTEPGQIPATEPETYEPRYTEEDVYIVAQMLQGECYEDNEECQRNAAITVCNRVGQGYWARFDTPTKVVKCTGFYGWHEDNVPSETNLRIAREVLDDWSAISAGYDRPWEPWLYFSSGGNGSNVYREEA